MTKFYYFIRLLKKRTSALPKAGAKHRLFVLCLLLMSSAAIFSLPFGNSFLEDDYGIEINENGAVLYFTDQGWNGSWNYLCLGEDCRSGIKNGNRWERSLSGITEAATYNIQLKIAIDEPPGQYISPVYSVVAQKPGNNVPTCTDGIQNGDETGVDCGGSCPNSCQPSEPAVAVSTSGTYGQILSAGPGSGKPGYSLYTFDIDTDEFSQCYDNCETNWPPFTVEQIEDLVIASSVPAVFPESFGLSSRCDGTLQVTYSGKPLYYYIGDNASGQTNGHGTNNTWWLIKNETTPTCDDGIQNGDETGIDCGGSCVACDVSDNAGTCEDFGLTIINGQGIIYFNAEAGKALYLCSNGFSDCYPPDKNEDGYYQRYINVTAGQSYHIAVQSSTGNREKTVIAGSENCFFQPSCTDGVQNGDETGVDCGGSCQVCPTCDDGIQNGDETGVDCGGSNCSISCEEVCNGTPNPDAEVSKKNESVAGENDGSITFTFSDVAGRSNLEFSINDGVSYPYSTSSSVGTYTINNLAPATYKLWVRWGNDDCPISLGDVQIQEGGAKPTCSDGILNQGEERVDCGGPNCAPCAEDPCGGIPLVIYPKPALPTPVQGSNAGQGFAFDLSSDLSKVTVRYGSVVDIQSGGNPYFEFHCSCNQVKFSSVKVDGTAQVPADCKDAGNYYYFFRYKKQGNTTSDPGDQYVYSALFTTYGDRIDPDNRPTLIRKGANWMRFRHPHAQDGITEAIFDAQHNSDKLRYLDRFETTFTDAASGLYIDPHLTSAIGQNHPHAGADVTPVRIDYMEKGDTSPPGYAKGNGNKDAGKWGYGNIVTYEITAVAGGTGAQTYNTFQNYVIGDGLNTLGDPRLAMAGRASTYMVLPGFGSHVKMEKNAIFTQHITTLTDEDDVDDFLEGHHLFHGVKHRNNGDDPGNVLGEVLIGEQACGNCHFRDGRSSELINTPKGKRVAPPVYGTGLLQHIAGAEVGLTWDGSVETVRDQTKNALILDHKVNPETMDQHVIDQIVAYTEFLTVPTRSPGAYDLPGVAEGDLLFTQVGCSSCHQVTQKTSSSAPPMFRDLVIRPYTDMKTHNVNGGNFRTSPLWGLGRNIDLLERNQKALLLMHDGSASTLDEAIQKHSGDASSSRAAYNQLSAAERDNIIKFLKTL